MEGHVKDFIMNIEPGEMQVHKNLAIIPLCMNGNGGQPYITLKEAFEKGTLTVTEITEHDMHGYDTYRVAEDGAIFDRDGAIKGWVHGNTVYDAGWDEKYIILENRL